MTEQEFNDTRAQTPVANNDDVDRENPQMQIQSLPHKIVKRFEVDSIQILDAEGNIRKGVELPNIDDSVLKQKYELMKLLRAFDNKALNLQRQGRMGTYSEFKGEEASQVGSVMALEEGDWFFPTYRDSAAMIARGAPMEELLRYWSGDEAGEAFSAELKIFPIAIPVASQVPHAVGAAWALRYQGKKAVALVTIGDGGTSKADFYESLNIAGVFQVPVICVIQNNQYAISLPREYQSHTATLAQKGFAFGIEAVQVDGNDLLAVYSVVSRMVRKAREGGGPAIIECITYRLGHHTTATGDEPYRLEAEIEKWKHRDPIERLRRYLERKGLWSEEYEREVDERVKNQIDEAVRKFEQFPRPSPQAMFDYTYSSEPQKLQDQEKDLLEVLERQSKEKSDPVEEKAGDLK